MLLGSLLGFIGALLGATGQSINQMIASGVFFGVGAGFQEMSYVRTHAIYFPLVFRTNIVTNQACVQEIVPNKYRFWAVGEYP
jgi:hypothetical protein